jgi:hypothetical protein
LSARSLHGIKDIVSHLIVTSRVTKNPLVFLEVDRLLDGQSSEDLFVAVDDLILPENLRSIENLSGHFLSFHI